MRYLHANGIDADSSYTAKKISVNFQRLLHLLGNGYLCTKSISKLLAIFLLNNEYSQFCQYVRTRLPSRCSKLQTLLKKICSVRRGRIVKKDYGKQCKCHNGCIQRANCNKEHRSIIFTMRPLHIGINEYMGHSLQLRD